MSDVPDDADDADDVAEEVEADDKEESDSSPFGSGHVVADVRWAGITPKCRHSLT